MRHRIFIAINLPEDIKKELSFFQEKWPELPCHWTRKENLHITLAFLGYLTDEEIVDVCKIVRETALRHKPFSVNFNKVIYGPPKKPPRMIWAEGKKSEELKKLQKDLENYPDGLSAGLESENGRNFSLHITLGRLKPWEFRRIEPEERPEINEEIDLNFEVNSIEVMESRLKRGGPEYIILELCPLTPLEISH